MKYSAVIFDLDGTVLVNEEVYARAFIDVLKKHLPAGRQAEALSDLNHDHPQEPGIGLKENWELLRKRCKLPKEIPTSQLVHETQDAYHSRIDEVKIRSGFFELHRALSKEDIIMALATSNDWWMVEDLLKDTGLHKYFETVVTGEEVVQKKPAPDIFIETARKLGVDLSECVVIEDSRAGIEAAKEAGMVAVAVLTSFTKPEDFPKADWVAKGFEELNPKLFDSFFAQ